MNMLILLATSKAWTHNLGLDPDPEKPGPLKTWTLESLDHEKRERQLIAEKKTGRPYKTV